MNHMSDVASIFNKQVGDVFWVGFVGKAFIWKRCRFTWHGLQVYDTASQCYVPDYDDIMRDLLIGRAEIED